MDLSRSISKVKIVFFSGTGSTTRVANEFKKVFEAKERSVSIHELNNRVPMINEQEELLVIIYPVHACNAPEAVYQYIENTAVVNKTPAAVISVSGGGEVTPNTACRLHCINRLEKKGFKVIYEKMLVMPSNWIVPTLDDLAIRLLEVLPHRVNKITTDLLSGITHRTKPNLLNKLLSNIGELEKPSAHFFGKRIRVNKQCNSCGWCERACPRTNISLVNGIPNFKGKCSLCLKCIYGCPQKALRPGIGKFIIVKGGYNLNSIEKRTEGKERDSIESLAKGYLWKGVKDYLLEDQ